MTYRRGLLIGRFQPLHFGHIHLVHEALKQIQTIILGVGSAQDYRVHIDENPYSYKIRKKMLDEMIRQERLENRIESVTPLTDYPDDDVWRKRLLEKTGMIDVVVTNNDWVSGIFERVSIPTLSIPLYKRELYEGKKIREILKDSDRYQAYLPKYVWRIIRESQHRRGRSLDLL